MIINLCDFCGHATKPGKNQELRAVTITPKRTKRWIREDNAPTRYARVQLRIGLDGNNPEMEHPGHDLCDECRIKLLREVLRRIEETTR